jgi:hypothetical protein
MRCLPYYLFYAVKLKTYWRNNTFWRILKKSHFTVKTLLILINDSVGYLVPYPSIRQKTRLTLNSHPVLYKPFSCTYHSDYPVLWIRIQETRNGARNRMTSKKPANTKSCDTVAVQHPPTPAAPSPSPRKNAKRQRQAAATPAVHLSSPE